MSAIKTALVTGANRGIGREVARQLAQRGMRVFIGVRNEQAGLEAAREIPGAEAVQIDVANPASIGKAAAELGRKTEHLDVLVNNAAILLDRGGNVLELPLDTLWQTLETNVVGPLRVAQAFAPLLRKGSAPRIINVSSGAGQLSEGLQS